MTKFNTGNPVGSSDPRDLLDNSAVADNLLTGEAPAYNDRLGKSRKSWQGIESEFASFIAAGGYVGTGTDGAIENYAAGIEITGYNQIVRDASGEFWRLSGPVALPYTTTGAGLPEGGAFVAVGDAALRQELNGPPSSGQGAVLVKGAMIYVESVAELYGSVLNDGAEVETTSYHPSAEIGGAAYTWQSLKSKADHDGISVIDPDKPFPLDWSVSESVSDWFTATNTGSGCFVLKDKHTTYSQCGILPTITDNLIAFRKANEVLSAGSLKSLTFDFDDDTPVSDAVFVLSDSRIYWKGSGFLKLSQSSTIGALLVCGAQATTQSNIEIHNPRVDCSDLGYPTSKTYGENGVAGTDVSNVRVFGGISKNCRRGASSAVGTGGKGIQFENGVSDIIVDGFKSENCTIAMESGGVVDSTDFRSSTLVTYQNMVAVNCERIVSLQQTNSPPDQEPSVNSFIINGVSAFNCGREGVAGTEKDYGPIVIDRAYNYSITGVQIINDETYGVIPSVAKIARGGNGFIEATLFGDSDYGVEHSLSSGFGSTGDLDGNAFSVKVKGACGTGIYSDTAIETTADGNIYEIQANTFTTGILNGNAVSSGSYGDFKETSTAKNARGPLNNVFESFAGGFHGTAPSAIVGATVLNGVLFSFGGAGQILTSDSDEDLVLARNFSNKLILKPLTVWAGIPTFSDNSAAITGGLGAGDLYKTSTGEVRAVV